nr:autotransporter-associated beta strand repeat-containing protein [Thermoguttaceae bacterium]
MTKQANDRILPARILTRGVLALWAVFALPGFAGTARADLVAYWTFNDYADGTLLSATTDSSGNGFTCTNVGDANYRPSITSSNPLYGSHLQRNNATAESKSNCNITAADVSAGDITISFWGTQPTTNWRDYITFRTDSTGEEFQFQKANNGLVIYKTKVGATSSGTVDNVLGSSELSLGTNWHHFVLTADSSTQKATLYIDGVQIDQRDWGYSELVTHLTFNGVYMWGGRGSNANLDEVQIYNQSMTADQVAFLYNNPSLYQATVYQRNVAADGNWSEADWNANGLTGQAFANSSAVQLTAENAPTLTADQNVTVNSIDFTGSMTVGGSNTITFNGEKRITVANAADAVTISAPITAQYDNSITKTGAGTLTLSGTNTHTGGTVVSEGTLAVTNTNALGTGAVTVNGGTLDTTPAGSGQTFANGLVIGANGGTVTTAAGTNLAGPYTTFASVSGSGDLTTNGWVQFNGTGGYDGHLTVNSGYTQINPGAVGVIDLTMNSGSHLSLLNAGTLQIGKLNATADVEIVGSQSGNAYTIEIGTGTTSSDTAAFAGYIHSPTTNSNNVTIKKVGAGTQTFNRGGYGYASPNGTIKEVIIDGGKMIIDATHSVYTAGNTTGFWGTAPITINAGGTLVYSHNWNTSPNVMLTVNGGTLTLNAFEYQNKITLNSGLINGTTALRVGFNGAGVWNVTGGTSTVDLQIVTVRTDNYNTFTINIADGATLDFKKNIVGLAESNSYKGTNLIVNGTGTNKTGKIKFNPAPNVIYKDMGTVSFNDINVEMVGDASWLGSGYFNGSAVTLKNSTMTTNTPHTTNGTVFTLDNSSLIFNGEVNSYCHQITLKNGSTISGTTDGSQFRTGHNWNSQFFTVYEDGKPENVMNTISADIAMYDTRRTTTFNIADKAPLTFSGSFVPAADGHYNAVTKTGAGTLTLTGANQHGATTVSEGTLVLAGNGTLGTGTTTVGANGTLEFNVADGEPKYFAFNTNTQLTSTGKITKTGDGTLRINAGEDCFNATTLTVVEGRLDMKEYLKGRLEINNGAAF